MSWSVKCDACGGWTPATILYTPELVAETGAKLGAWLATDERFRDKVGNLSVPDEVYESTEMLRDFLRDRGFALQLAPGPDCGPAFCFECGRPYYPDRVEVVTLEDHSEAIAKERRRLWKRLFGKRLFGVSDPKSEGDGA